VISFVLLVFSVKVPVLRVSWVFRSVRFRVCLLAGAAVATVGLLLCGKDQSV
jgi:hypothetical protein